jgi:hypothetical protein
MMCSHECMRGLSYCKNQHTLFLFCADEGIHLVLEYVRRLSAFQLRASCGPLVHFNQYFAYSVMKVCDAYIVVGNVRRGQTDQRTIKDVARTLYFILMLFVLTGEVDADLLVIQGRDRITQFRLGSRSMRQRRGAKATSALWAAW